MTQKLDILTHYRDGSSVNNKLNNISNRLNALTGQEPQNNVKDKTDTTKLKTNYYFQHWDENSIVYLNNNFGNAEHPEATRSINGKNR